MRIAAQVLVAYALILLMGCLWRLSPWPRIAPDLVALSAVYLGLTARHQLAPSMAGAVIMGYLGDLLLGSPHGLLAFVAGVVCILGHVIHRRLLVRGLLVTVAVAFVTGLASGLIGLGLRAYAGLIPESVGVEFGLLAGGAAMTAVFGPPVLRAFRAVDARFARTYRERDAMSEGIRGG